jgi:hypothetical protein
MRDHYKELFQTSVKELRFANLCVDNLYNTLDEIEAFTTDELVKMVIKNTKERHNLDKFIHAKLAFTE